MITKFNDYLAKTNLAKNTVASYVWTVNYFFSHYGEVNKKNLLAYKGYLVENFKPQTVNLRLQGINKYLEFSKHDRLKVKFVKVQQKNFLENVISDADYKFLKAQLKVDGYEDWYFVVWFMAATGARVSELLHIKVEHVKVGYLDLYSKGGKVRRLYIPKNLRSEALQWLKTKGVTSGYLFLNRFGQRITTRGIAQQLKHFADKYGLNRDVVYPHSFRHRFAKNFLDRFNDLALLTDLMGHESIETTRIYLRRTASEQQKIVDKVVNWWHKILEAYFPTLLRLFECCQELKITLLFLQRYVAVLQEEVRRFAYFLKPQYIILFGLYFLQDSFPYTVV